MATGSLPDGGKTLVIDHNNGVLTYETRDGALSYRGALATHFQPSNACALGEKQKWSRFSEQVS